MNVLYEMGQTMDKNVILKPGPLSGKFEQRRLAK
jgi:hypothetical protein